ncbi:MAG TPA: ABC transporter ATP-binding protein [Clostridiaceae bacterium]|nr:ABC transporter ATP-binding protein [Clostridiaceae bacterium]
MVVLSLIHLSKNYRKTQVLYDISFELFSGEILGFIGPNGAGKSTTMKCIAGLEYYQSGSIHIMGYNLAKRRNEALAHIGLSIESPGLYPQLTGLEHLKYFGQLRKLPKSRVDEMIEFSKLGKSIHRATATYSMGMKQRLALSLALLTKPDLLLLDEPTNGLDPSAVFTLREELKELKKQGVAILYSSHQLDELERICDRTVFIQEGRLIDTKDIDQVRFRSYSFYLTEKEAALSSIHLAFPDVYIAIKEDNAIELRVLSDETFAEIIKHLTRKGFSITSIHENRIGLEESYASFYKQ